MSKKLVLFLLCFYLFLSIPACNKAPGDPDIPSLILPVIAYFEASPEAIHWGETSTLLWSVTNATTIEINRGIGIVPAESAIGVSPEESTTYTLTAKNNDGQKTASCIVEVLASAIFELTYYRYGYTSYGCCEITGIVKNIGNATGYNVGIEFQAYNANNVIIDTAHGFPAGLGNIPAGIEASFDAIFFDTHNWNVIAKTSYEITWLTAKGMKLKQTGLVPIK